MRIAIYICSKTVPASVANLLSAFQNANDFIGERMFETVLISEKPGPFGGDGVLLVPQAGLNAMRRVDLVIVPAATGTLEEARQECPAFLRALPWGLLILAVNYIWVVHSDARFEEASAEFADKIADIRKGKRVSQRKQKPVRPAPFTLSLEGRAEIAILWKNLILLGLIDLVLLAVKSSFEIGPERVTGCRDQAVFDLVCIHHPICRSGILECVAEQVGQPDIGLNAVGRERNRILVPPSGLRVIVAAKRALTQ